MKGTPLFALVVVAAVLGGCSSSSSAPTAKPSATAGVNLKNPLAATTLMQQGQALVNEGRPLDGLEKYKGALSIQPKNPTIHNLIGVALLQSGNAAEALVSFTRALDLAPSYSDARNNRGAAYARLGQFAMAESDFYAVLADSTYANRAGVYFNLGSLYVSRDNLAAGEENLRKASVPSGPVEALMLLGSVEERLGKLERAESALRDAITRAPERADIVLALARLLERLGRKDESRELFRKVLMIAPDSPEAREAKAHVGA